MEILLEIRPRRPLYALLNLITGLMEILLERIPWRLLYVLLVPWSYGNITWEKTMASFVCPTWFLVLWKYYLREDHDVLWMPYLVPGLMEILLERRPWRLLYAVLGPWSYGNITWEKTMASFACPSWSLVLWKYYLRENLGVFCMHYLVPGLMEILLEGRPWRIVYALLGPWSYGNITWEKTMASLYALLGSWCYGNITWEKTMTSFVCPTWSLVLWKYYLREDHDVFCMPYLVPGFMEILLERRPWLLLYALLGLSSYGNITWEKTMASFVCPTWSMVLWKYY
jgi:predicted RNA-binding Zn-ribbon protein involved in translation (DUF1610 family)